MRWLHSEYLLKGIFLGLLLFAALQQPDPGAAALVGLCLGGGLALGLAAAFARTWRAGYRPQGKPLAFVLFLLLENPAFVYAGSLLGLAAGALAIRGPDTDPRLLPFTVGGSAALGLGLSALRTVRRPYIRLLAGMLAAAVLAGLAVWGLESNPDHPLIAADYRRSFGAYLLLGLPFFYLLTFVGEAEESEVEVAAWCAALAVGVWMVRATPSSPAFGLLLPLLIYLIYSTRVLPGLRTFKHVLRGHGYARAGRLHPALRSLRRALELAPNDRAAREGLWEIHRKLDPARVGQDPELLGLIDPHLCLDRVADLLLGEKPSAAQVADANHLLDLVESQHPDLQPRVHYWRAVAAAHARDLDVATELLTKLLDPGAWPAGDLARRSVLLPAWQLAVTLHPELNRRVGTPELAQPGRRLEAIAAVERGLADAPEDAGIWALKRVLYSGLTEADYAAGPVAEFDAAYAQQLGLALIDDPAQWRRGAEYLRIAAHGLPAIGPSTYQQIAKACERAGDWDGVRFALEGAKRAGLAVGHKNLSALEREAYFAAVRRLAEDADARSDLESAIADYQLYAEAERSGLETLRRLADLHERRGDALSALREVERGLVYDPKDADLLARRDKYAYSVTPDALRAAPEGLRQAVDVGYCVRKARQLMELRDADAEVLDWARHLAELAAELRPNDPAVKVLLARVRLRLGERDAALAVLEDVFHGKPEKFASDDEEDAWLLGARLLGDLYLNDYDRPDLAIPCFTAYRSSAKSGADTLYKLGQAHERTGDARRAAKFYEQVTGYDGHPLASSARDALWRVKSQVG